MCLCWVIIIPIHIIRVLWIILGTLTFDRLIVRCGVLERKPSAVESLLVDRDEGNDDDDDDDVFIYLWKERDAI